MGFMPASCERHDCQDSEVFSAESDLEHPGVLWDMAPLAMTEERSDWHSVNRELNRRVRPLLITLLAVPEKTPTTFHVQMP
jgi:hypothetical protein